MKRTSYRQVAKKQIYKICLFTRQILKFSHLFLLWAVCTHLLNQNEYLTVYY